MNTEFISRKKKQTQFCKCKSQNTILKAQVWGYQLESDMQNKRCGVLDNSLIRIKVEASAFTSSTQINHSDFFKSSLGKRTEVEAHHHRQITQD